MSTQPPPANTNTTHIVIAAAVALGTLALLGCLCAGIGFWWLRDNPAVAKAPDGKGGKAVNLKDGNAAVKPNKDMSWQELHNTLKARGINVNRQSSKKHLNGMWFAPPGWMDHWEHALTADDVGSVFHEGAFLVKKMPDEAAAKAWAAERIDRDQRFAFSWGVFVFDSVHTNLLKNIQAQLGKG